MDFIKVDAGNIESEHVCCAISDKKGECGVACKKAWLKENFAHGLVFEKLDVRGKVFIEYLPAEKAWCPITAPGYFYIDCFWVSGQYKGKGYGKALLARCIEAARAEGKQGLVVLSSKKKLPFLSDPGFLKKNGFLVADTAAPSYELLYLPLLPGASAPKFLAQAKEGKTGEMGLVLYYTHQCPHTSKYAPLVEEAAVRHDLPVTLHLLESAGQAQGAPAPFTTYSLFYNGALVASEILSEKKLEQLLVKLVG